VKIATLDPCHGYKNAIDDELEDAVAVLDAFLPRKREVPPVVKLGTKAVDDVRRRLQTDIHGHRGRKGDPLYRIRTTLRAGEENLTQRQRERLTSVWESDERHVAVEVAWACSQQLRSTYHQHTHAAGRVIAQQGIYSSQITVWRKLRDVGVLAGRNPGVKIGRLTPEQAEIVRLRRQLAVT
jgi:hypothetical protein